MTGVFEVEKRNLKTKLIIYSQFLSNNSLVMCVKQKQSCPFWKTKIVKTHKQILIMVPYSFYLNSN